jgi:hypothetical protein
MLLNMDIRVLAKALANRLGPVLGKEVTLEQSAFLPDRLIGANVMSPRQLPHLMERQGRSYMCPGVSGYCEGVRHHRPGLSC